MCQNVVLNWEADAEVCPTPRNLLGSPKVTWACMHPSVCTVQCARKIRLIWIYISVHSILAYQTNYDSTPARKTEGSREYANHTTRPQSDKEALSGVGREEDKTERFVLSDACPPTMVIPNWTLEPSLVVIMCSWKSEKSQMVIATWEQEGIRGKDRSQLEGWMNNFLQRKLGCQIEVAANLKNKD